MTTQQPIQRQTTGWKTYVIEISMTLGGSWQAFIMSGKVGGSTILKQLTRFSRWFCSFWAALRSRFYSLVSTWNATSFPCRLGSERTDILLEKLRSLTGILYFQSTHVNHFKKIYLFIQNLHIWLYYSRQCVCLAHSVVSDSLRTLGL